jgi:hypothetical protein
MDRYEDVRTIEIYREGSERTDFDLEYEIEYAAFVDYDDEDGAAEADGILSIIYYPTPHSRGIPLTLKELSPELRAKIDALISKDVKANETSLRAAASSKWFEREEAREGEAVDRAIDERGDR